MSTIDVWVGAAHAAIGHSQQSTVISEFGLWEIPDFDLFWTNENRRFGHDPSSYLSTRNRAQYTDLVSVPETEATISWLPIDDDQNASEILLAQRLLSGGSEAWPTLVKRDQQLAYGHRRLPELHAAVAHPRLITKGCEQLDLHTRGALGARLGF
jgi:hypothetical protein